MKITIQTGDSELTADIEAGKTLLDAINTAGVEGFDAPCGGKGTCGKCRIRVLSAAPEPDALEARSLSAGELAGGIRLACRVKPETDMEISLSSGGSGAVIQSGFEGAISAEAAADESIYTRRFVELPAPAIDDQRSDRKRLFDALAADGIADGITEISLPVLKKLPAVLREADFRLVCSLFGGRLVDAASSDTEAQPYYAAAVDIGTTTVVAYLVQLSGGNAGSPGGSRGEVLDHVSGLNSQKGYGGDVISRIEYCMQQPQNLGELQSRITGQVSSLVRELAERGEIPLESIGLVTLAGNTTMMHLFAGLDPVGIAAAPFIPVDTGLMLGDSADFGLDLPGGCACAVLPGISSYVGADIVAGIAATGMHETDDLCLLIDIGTNGEIVLGSRQGMTACSTAAGPALEGANISCGMGGIPGAVNSLSAEEVGGSEVFSFSVIDGVEPVGVCGSGIIDALALFRGAGLIDETGRILPQGEAAEAGVHQSWIDCLAETSDGLEITITDGISLTQKDVREIQTAKAAIAAGVKTLLAETGKTTADIKRLYIAGGFGAAMNKKSAAAIGLFPPELEDAVVIAGNTAGKGAVLAALSKKMLKRMEEISEEVNYIELSTSALFQQEYMMGMYF